MHFHRHLSFLVNTEGNHFQVDGRGQAHVNIVVATFKPSEHAALTFNTLVNYKWIPVNSDRHSDSPQTMNPNEFSSSTTDGSNIMKPWYENLIIFL